MTVDIPDGLREPLERARVARNAQRTFDEQTAMEAARERSAVPSARDLLKREEDRLSKGHRRDVALERWGPVLDEMMMRDLELLEKQAPK